MLPGLIRRRAVLLWQILLMLLGTTWLWAPQLNHLLSYRTSLISQYETSFQAYSWFFRSGDFLAGMLVLVAGIWFLKAGLSKVTSWLLIAIGTGMALDPLLSTTCTQIGNSCQEYFSFDFLLHAIETVITACAFFLIGFFDAATRRRVVSMVFFIFQIAYGILFATQLANQGHFNTISQYSYQLVLIIWLAWFLRDYLKPNNFEVSASELNWTKNLVAVWAFLNSIVAILISLAHIHLLGKLKALYFVGDSAWLAQHGVVVGIIMLYLSRHLARGERRARQIFVTLLGLEVIKYSLISPHAGLLILYVVSFIALFVLRDDFRRGTIPLTRHVRLMDLLYMIVGLLIAVGAAAISLDRDGRVAGIASRAIDNFSDYVTNTDTPHMSHLRSILLDQTLVAFIIGSAAVILWILFRPYKTSGGKRDYQLVEQRLKSYSRYPDDYFKLWPHDKDYFWSQAGGGFIAYKRTGPVVFGLADPIGAKPLIILNDFVEWSRSHRLKACLLPIFKESRSVYDQAGMNLLKVGSSALVDTSQFLDKTAKGKWWRWIKNKSEKAGYEYLTSQPPHTNELLNELRRTSQAWLRVGDHTERGFALGYFDYYYLNQCAIHYLTLDAQVIAFTNEVPQFKALPTKTIDLMRYRPEYDHSMPYLLYRVIDDLNSKNVPHFDLGLVPFAQAEGPIQTVAQALSDRRFSSKGLRQFKNKFDPVWQPNYLAYDGDLADLGVIALHIERTMQI